MEKLFFDTEFTGLHKDTTLISIGICDSVGTTFYAELTDYDESQVDDWIRENVIEKLRFKDKNPGGRVEPILFARKSFECKGTKLQVREWLLDWLKQYENVEFVSDVCHYDMVLLIDLLSGTALDLPEKISPACYDINQDIANFERCSMKKAFDISRNDLISKFGYKVSGKSHNALNDALTIKAIYKSLKEF